MENIVVNEVVGGKLVRLNLQISLEGAVIGNGKVLPLHKTQHIRGRNPVAGGRVFCGGNVQRHGAVLGTPLLGVARTLHVNGAALGRDEEGVHAIVLVAVGNGRLKSGGLLHWLGIRLGLLVVVLSRGQVGGLDAVRTLEVQILPGQQSAAALGGLTHDGSDELVAALVAVVAPHFDGVLLRRIQGVSGNLNVTVEESVLVLERILGVVVLDNVADSQDGGVRTLLTNKNLHALGGVNIAVEVPAIEVKILVLGCIGKGTVTPVRGEGVGLSLLVTAGLRGGVSRQGAGGNGRGCFRSHILSQRRAHGKHHGTGENQRTASLCCAGKRRRGLRVRQRRHHYPYRFYCVSHRGVRYRGKRRATLRNTAPKTVRHPRAYGDAGAMGWLVVPVGFGDDFTLPNPQPEITDPLNDELNVSLYFNL